MTNTFDPDKVYLITLAGQGDIERKLVNHETYHYVINGGDAPAAQVALFAKNGDVTDTEAAAYLNNIDNSNDNDRALAVRPDKFNGERLNGWDASTKDVMAFLKKHDLELSDDEYEGYIY